MVATLVQAIRASACNIQANLLERVDTGLKARPQQALPNVRVPGLRVVAQFREQPGRVFRNRRSSPRCPYRVRGSNIRVDAV